MNDQKEVVGIVNDLLRINHDRINGYEKAIKETKSEDSDLRALFTRMEDESRKYANELTQLVTQLGGEPAKDTTQSGKIYRVWMDVKATFTGSDRHAILAACEYGEDAAQRAYDSALKSENKLPADVQGIITRQKGALRTSHDEIKKLRDMTHA